MRIPRKLQKRSWGPYVSEKDGQFNPSNKWHTGYDSKCHGAPRFEQLKGEAHEVRTLKIKPQSVYTGRSSANMIFVDTEGHEYEMTLSGGFELVKKLIAKTIESEGEFLIADFTQVKKGSNLFIQVYEEEE